MDDALKGQVIDTINNAYLCDLGNKKNTGYLVLIASDLLDHLIDCYGKNTPGDLLETNKKEQPK